MLALTGMLLAAYVGGTADRADAVKIADVLKGKTKQDILTSAGVLRNESTSQGLTAMVYQGSRARRTRRPWREIERCAERAASLSGDRHPQGRSSN